jgi:hypothetical protein
MLRALMLKALIIRALKALIIRTLKALIIRTLKALAMTEFQHHRFQTG